MTSLWDDDGLHAKCGVFHINLQCRADGMFGWEAATPGYCGWQSGSAYQTKGAARADAENWLREQVKEIQRKLPKKEATDGKA